jgi:uncharacterized membrane protein YhaH (DUF805 family)
MFGIGFPEFLLILIFLFPLPPLVTAFLARKKGKRFWPWVGIGFLITVSANLLTGVVKAKIAPATPLPELQLIVGALAGPLLTLFLRAAAARPAEAGAGDPSENR